MKFKTLVEVIHQSTEAALQSVAKANIDFFSHYFRAVQPADGGAADAAGAHPSIAGAEGATFEPRVVKLQMLKPTATGMAPHQVTVPLISLIPYANIQPSEIDFEIDLECVEKDGEVLVAFPQVRRTLLGGEQVVAVRKNAKLSIRLTASDRVPGVSAIIETYDRLLRAQLPS
ncbi:MAG: DUF2589 domain-containing protein [Sphingomonadales bacterium]|nr:DUF2589 domain-containing protein [Sphingomonadales bacterium]